MCVVLGSWVALSLGCGQLGQLGPGKAVPLSEGLAQIPRLLWPTHTPAPDAWAFWRPLRPYLDAAQFSLSLHSSVGAGRVNLPWTPALLVSTLQWLSSWGLQRAGLLPSPLLALP